MSTDGKWNSDGSEFLFISEVKVEKERNLWYPYSLGYVMLLRTFDMRKLWTIGDKTAWM